MDYDLTGDQEFTLSIGYDTVKSSIVYRKRAYVQAASHRCASVYLACDEITPRGQGDAGDRYHTTIKRQGNVARVVVQIRIAWPDWPLRSRQARGSRDALFTR